MRPYWISGLFTVLLAILPSTGHAAEAQPGAFGQARREGLPVAVDADQAIEWHQDQKAYVARGNAVATRGDLTVKAPVLIAYYRDAAQGGTEIFRLAADGGVTIVSPAQTVYGERAVYDIDQQVAVVTGNNLKLVTPRDIVTARDSLEYWEAKRLAVARGDAVAVRDRNKVQADMLVGQFEEAAGGSLEMQRIDAQGNVVVTSPNDVARGQNGVYNLKTEIANLTGNVRITRGQNHLEGDAAEVNMVTGVSRLVRLDDGKPGARVRALLVPGQQPGASATGTKGGGSKP